MCGSDAHQLITGKYGLSRMPRPMTLVFAKERSVGGIKEALFARRSAVMFHDLLIGPADPAPRADGRVARLPPFCT